MQKKQLQNGFGAIGIFIVLISLIVLVVGAWRWLAWSSTTHPATSKTSPAPNSNSTLAGSLSIFKIPELGVEFDLKNGVKPLYFTKDIKWSDISYKVIRFSTQQLVDKGVLEDDKNACDFSSFGGHALFWVAVFNSQSDLLNSDFSSTKIVSTDVKPENGYFAIGEKIYAIPQKAQLGYGSCAKDANFETTQWQSLQQSLMTIRSGR